MMKKISLLLISITFLLFICGCDKEDKKTHLKFSSWGSESEIATIKPLLAQFEKQNPTIKVEFIHIPKNYFQKLHLLVASNLTPDVVFINNFNSPMYIKNNILEDLSPYIGKNKNIYFENALAAFKYGNKLYAMPRDVSNLVIYYNKDLFDKYKVKYPSETWNYQDFLSTAQKLTKKGASFGFGFEDNSLFWLPFLWSEGGGIINQDLSKIILDSPQSIKALEFYSDLRNKHHVCPSKAEQGSATTAQMFMQGRVAMHISGRWNVPRYREDIGFRWDIARFPYGGKGSIVDADASGWAMAKNSQHKKEAWKLIEFLSSKASSEKFTESGLIIPARKDVGYSKIFLDDAQKPYSAKIFLNVIKDGIPTPANENYAQITNTINSSLEALWDGKKTAERSVDKQTIKKLDELLN